MNPRGENSETIGIFGGSFDPPHVGHVLAVQYVLLTEPVSRVLVIPCAQHPFGKEQTPFRHRCEMCRLAFAPLGPAAQVLDVEGRREGASYTADTVRELQRRHPGARFLLILGSDIVAELPRWKDSAELLRLVSLRVLKRLEHNTSACEDDQEEPYYLPRVSGTALREMLAQGRDVSTRVPRAVLAYVEEHGLYRSS
jgi:nicotinate-nucleotide adenylyltransferase